MLLTMDVGNTNIKIALFDGTAITNSWRVATDIRKTSDEYGLIMRSLFHSSGLELDMVERIIYSSVVPPINFTIEHMCRDYFHHTPLLMSTKLNTGITYCYENPKELGSDRIANAVAAYTIYGGPCIFIDFGTATTFGVMSGDGAFLGGCICAGIKLTSEAIVSGTAKLPRFELIMPENVIGRTTIANLQSGILYGYVGQIEYIVRKIKEEIGNPDTRVVATGGMSRIVADASDVIDVIEPALTLKGLQIVSTLN